MYEDKFIRTVMKEAQKARKKGEIPVGAVIVKNNKIIAKAHNEKEKNKCSLDHAEILAIKKASKKTRNWRLNNCIMYVNLMPCPMCASAIKQSRISRVYYLLENKNEYNNDISVKIMGSSDSNKPVEICKIDNKKYNLNIVSEFFIETRN